MSNTEKYKQPVNGSRALVQSARGPFQTLLTFGLIVLGVAVIAGIVGFNSSDYGDEMQQVAAFSFSGSAVLWAVILLAAAGIVAGLGKREDAPEPTPAAE